MLARLMDIIGFRIEATDGTIGEVENFLFDEETWMVRYLVADTRRWIPGKKVLIAPQAFDDLNWAMQRFPVALTQDQVRESPDRATDLPVSRQWEADLHVHYGWKPYWDFHPVGHAPAWGSERLPVLERVQGVASAREHGDPHLRSVGEVKGYDVDATDGPVGHVEDFVTTTDVWKILYLEIGSHTWRRGESWLLPTDWIRGVSWPGHRVPVDQQRERIHDSPSLRPKAPITRDYEAKLFEHYGRTPYWAA